MARAAALREKHRLDAERHEAEEPKLRQEYEYERTKLQLNQKEEELAINTEIDISDAKLHAIEQFEMNDVQSSTSLKQPLNESRPDIHLVKPGSQFTPWWLIIHTIQADKCQ